MTETINLYKALVSILNERQKKYNIETTTINQETIFLHALDRLKKNLHSITVLIENSAHENEYLVELGLRNILTDFFVLIHIYNNKEKATELFCQLINENYEHAEKHFQLLDLKSNNEFKYHQSFVKLKMGDKLYHEVLERKTDGSFPTTTDIFKKYKKGSNQEMYVRMYNAFHKWFYFSKTEHIGWVSYLKINSPAIDYNLEKMLLESLGCVMYSAVISLQMLNDNEALESIDSLYLELGIQLKKHV